MSRLSKDKQKEMIEHAACEPPILDYPTDPTAAVQGMPEIENLKQAFGTETSEAASALFMTGLVGLGINTGPERPLMGAIGAEEKPASALESMLLQQLVMTHLASSRISFQLHSDAKPELKVALGKLLNGTTQAFTKQLEALRRIQSGPTQTMRVEHVTVNEGGQAIVGNVSSNGGRQNK